MNEDVSALMAIWRVSPELACQTVASAIIVMAGANPTTSVMESATALVKAFSEGVRDSA